jgi:hypothetical protein
MIWAINPHLFQWSGRQKGWFAKRQKNVNERIVYQIIPVTGEASNGQ